MLAEGKIATDKWYTFPAVSASDFISPLTGKIHSDFTCHYYYGSNTSVTEVILTSDDVKEAGLGGYSIRLGLAEFNAVGNVEVIIRCTGMVTYRLPVQVKTVDDEAANNKILGTVDANIVSMNSNVITASAVATGAIKDGAIASAERDNIAKSIFNLDLSSFVGEASRSLKNAIRFIRNKWSISGTTLTVTKEDDTTPAWTSQITTNASSDPITGSDPA